MGADSDRTVLTLGRHGRPGRALGQRAHFRSGARHRRRPSAEGRRGRHPRFSFGAGEVWGVLTGWRGNHTHYAERLSTGEQVIGGGELLPPGEVIVAEGESYGLPWVYGTYGVGLDAAARRFHQFLRARGHHPSPVRP